MKMRAAVIATNEPAEHQTQVRLISGSHWELGYTNSQVIETSPFFRGTQWVDLVLNPGVGIHRLGAADKQYRRAQYRCQRKLGLLLKRIT